MGRKAKPANKKPHTFVITPDQYKNLRERAYEHKTTLSFQIRKAIDQYLNRTRKKKEA